MIDLDYEERAAIREYLGGYTRAEAERLARVDLAREAELRGVSVARLREDASERLTAAVDAQGRLWP